MSALSLTQISQCAYFSSSKSVSVSSQTTSSLSLPQIYHDVLIYPPVSLSWSLLSPCPRYHNVLISPLVRVSALSLPQISQCAHFSSSKSVSSVCALSLPQRCAGTHWHTQFCLKGILEVKEYPTTSTSTTSTTSSTGSISQQVHNITELTW